jgi:hypothetical protein
MRRLVDSTAASITVSLAAACVILASPLGCSSPANDATQADRGNDNTKTVAAPTPVAVPEAAPVPTPPVSPPTPTPPADPEHGTEFCATIIPCFQQLEFSGSFSADVTVDIEPNGSVSSVSFTGQAPIPVQTCITDAIKNITLTDYNGKPGRTRCTKSGQLMGGTQMIMSDRTYELRDAAKAQAEPGKAAPAKREPAEANAG